MRSLRQVSCTSPHVIAAAECQCRRLWTYLRLSCTELLPGQSSRLLLSSGPLKATFTPSEEDIVATMLRIAGYNVVDLGRDVPIESYVEKAKEVKADVVASSALMSITIINQIQIEKQFREAGIRSSLKTMGGRCACNPGMGKEYRGRYLC